MNVKLKKSNLNGTVNAVSSKSQAHRALICSALANKPTCIVIKNPNNDISATSICLENMGAGIEQNADVFFINPITKANNSPILNCYESGSTLRFLLPVCAAIFSNAIFEGEGRLPKRPISELVEVLKNNGKCFTSDKFPLSMSGSLSSGIYKIPADVSSQYISGLLMALPLLDGESEIIYTSPVKSTPYIDMTTDMLCKFGVNILKTDTGIRVPGNQKYKSPQNIYVEGDWSNAAFWLCAGAIGGNVCINNLNYNSLQGDRLIVDYLKRFGANIEINENSVNATNSKLHGTDIDVSKTPDLLPILAVVASAAEGKTTLYNAKHLRYKESDRLTATTEVINSLGGKVTEIEDKLEIYGKELVGGVVDSHNDHRIVMSAAIASTLCTGETTILNADAVNKSYPSFFNDYKLLGGHIL